MRFIVAGFGILLLCGRCVVEGGENNKCYDAKICVHNGKEKCGINTAGVPRRFFDSCDINEYNCLNNADYAKTSADKCTKLPPISDDNGFGHIVRLKTNVKRDLPRNKLKLIGTPPTLNKKAH